MAPPGLRPMLAGHVANRALQFQRMGRNTLNNTIHVRVKVAALHFHDARGGRGIDGKYTFTYPDKHHTDEPSGAFKALVDSIATRPMRPSNVSSGPCRARCTQSGSLQFNMTLGTTHPGKLRDG